MGWRNKIRLFYPQEILGPVATLYEKVATPGLSGFYREVSSEVASRLARGRVLDIGTGPGHLIVELKLRNPNLELTGVDLSRSMLKIARGVIEKETNAHVISTSEDKTGALSGGRDSQGIRLIRADAGNLPFSDGEFDLVVSTLSLHHWRDPRRVFRECLRVTVPGGECWIYDLRTDASLRSHAALVTKKGLVGLIMSLIFKFHGVGLKEYESGSAASRLGNGATVRTEAHAAYLKITIRKTHSDSRAEPAMASTAFEESQ